MLAYQMPQKTTETGTEDLTFAAPPDAPNSAPVGATFVKTKSNDSRDIQIVRGKDGDKHEVTMHFRPGYMYRQANWEIGRAAERSKTAMAVRPFKPGDRFAAWRKRAARMTRNAERRAIGRSNKGKKK